MLPGDSDSRSRLTIVPCSLTRANEYVATLHRHHQPLPTNGGGFAVAVADELGLVRGVAIAGRPVARLLDDGWTLEANRVATDQCPNACSALYGAVGRIAKQMGYRRVLTYTRQDESGSSLRGAGWTLDDPHIRARKWDMPGRRRKDKTEIIGRQRWVLELAPELPALTWPHARPSDQLALEVVADATG